MARVLDHVVEAMVKDLDEDERCSGLLADSHIAIIIIIFILL